MKDRISKKGIAYFTNIAPHYRDCLWRKLASEYDFEFHFFFGKTSQSGIKEINFESPDWEPYQNRIHNLKNFRIKGFIVWQKGVIREVFNKYWDTFIFLGDMLILSTWVSVIIARILRKPVFFWGHGLYGDETHIKLFFRRLFLSLADKHFLYNNRSKFLMVKAGFVESKLYVVYNSLNYDEHLQLRNSLVGSEFNSFKSFFKQSNHPVLIFIGRLIPDKKLELLIQAVNELNAQKYYTNLIIIGDGPMLSVLKNHSESVDGAVYFYGPCYDEKEIGRLISNASLCVSPGSVGLTSIHSLSFGTPIISHSNFSKQMPEFEAIEDRVTGAFFEENNVESLKIVIRDWLQNHPTKDAVIKNACYAKVDMYYNPYYQVSIFKLALNQ